MTTTISTELQSSLTQEEKRREMEQDRKVREQQQRPPTFKDFASAFANETKGGRFAKSGTGSTVQPLPSGPWSPNQPSPGDEPSLGVNINQVERDR
jgi:hypothetical protein